MDRADIDDAPEFALAHAGQYRARHVGRAGEHHRDQQGPAIGREVLKPRDMLQAGVVYQHLDAPRGAHHRVDGGRLRHVEGDTGGLAAEGIDCVGDTQRGGAVAVGGDDFVAGRGQQLREFGTDAAAGAGDEDASCRHGLKLPERAACRRCYLSTILHRRARR